jgi:hypothetical protein
MWTTGQPIAYCWLRIAYFRELRKAPYNFLQIPQRLGFVSAHPGKFSSPSAPYLDKSVSLQVLVLVSSVH